MNEATVSAKGVNWTVTRDGRVSAEHKPTEYTRTRDGAAQRVTASYRHRWASPYLTKSGYLEVCAKRDGRRVKVLVHRLIGMAFVPGYSPGLTINHINGVKTDNRPENLEWVSLARNTQHQWETGLVNLRGENAPGNKLTSKQVVYIRRLLASGVPAHALAIVAGVSPSLIALIRDGKRWSLAPVLQAAVGDVDAEKRVQDVSGLGADDPAGGDYL